MRKLIFPLAAALAALFAAGCTGPEQKLGRGIANSADIVRFGELRRSVEQTSVFNSPDQGCTFGVIQGVDRTLQRTGFGLYEIVTFPFPPYHPVLTSYFTPDPTYPESYKPGLISDPLFDTDTYTGFSGGDIAPFVPGSRFRVFDN
jgi:putative exosortase-associated protein (TIGR04073 family)